MYRLLESLDSDEARRSIAEHSQPSGSFSLSPPFCVGRIKGKSLLGTLRLRLGSHEFRSSADLSLIAEQIRQDATATFSSHLELLRPSGRYILAEEDREMS